VRIPIDTSRYDLNSKFDVLVGSETFPLHTAVFTERSEFFRAARKPEWLAGDPNKPVDLEDEDAKVFNAYVNCVYFGPDALQQDTDEIEDQPENVQLVKKHETCVALVRLYQLADKLQDPVTANMVIDEIIRRSDVLEHVPRFTTISLVYSYTPANSPLRRLMCDCWVYEVSAGWIVDRKATSRDPFGNLPHEFVEDVLLEFYSAKSKGRGQTLEAAFSGDPRANEGRDKCHYHQHDDKHPRCIPKPGSG